MLAPPTAEFDSADDYVLLGLRALFAMGAFVGLAVLTAPTTQCIFYDPISTSLSTLSTSSINILLAVMVQVVAIASQIPGLVMSDVDDEVP